MVTDSDDPAIPLDEKQQTGWFDMPYEMRIMIIEMMDTKTRVKLSSCSKLCCQEVRRSKNFITSISLSWTAPGFGVIDVRIKDHPLLVYISEDLINGEPTCSIKYSYCAHVLAEKTAPTMVARSTKDIVLEHFNRFVNDAIYVNEIAIFVSDGFPYDETSIKHLKNLKTINIGGSTNLLDILSFKQLTSASHRIYMIGIEIGLEQLVKFKASYIIIIYPTYSTAQLNQHLKAWYNNKFDKNVKLVRITCSEENKFTSFSDDIINGFDVRPLSTGFIDQKFYALKTCVGKFIEVRISDKSLAVLPNPNDDLSENEYYSEYDDSV